jgi:SAM-dependent methyltransferase
MRRLWRIQGTAGLAQTFTDRLFGRTLAIAPLVCDLARGAKALEIGGPSGAFQRRRLLPIYSAVSSLDNVNYSQRTLWEANLADGGAYAPAGERLGTQYIREAADLRDLAKNSYDLVISSHTLEHCANPLAVLREWARVCKPDGYLILVLPHRDGTFDRKRQVTALAHLRSDEAADVDETDTTHVEEASLLHDIRRDPDGRSMHEVRKRFSENYIHRGLHHHVIDISLAVSMVAEAGWAPEMAEARRPHDIVVVARNGTPTKQVDVKRSPFTSDRRT